MSGHAGGTNGRPGPIGALVRRLVGEWADAERRARSVYDTWMPPAWVPRWARPSSSEAAAQRRALDDHYADYPQARPSLAEVALALAVIDGDELADSPQLIAQAAHEVVEYRPAADADDVLLWAASLLRRQRDAGATDPR